MFQIKTYLPFKIRLIIRSYVYFFRMLTESSKGIKNVTQLIFVLLKTYSLLALFFFLFSFFIV